MGRTANRNVSVSQLERQAATLWSELKPGSVVWLTGDLGTGKTTFVKALVRAASGPEARSPTFALIHEYDSPSGVIVHVDCYRLRDPGEALDLDFPGLLRAARLLLIEWPERAGCYAPPPNAHLHFEHGEAPDVRRLERLA